MKCLNRLGNKQPIIAKSYIISVCCCRIFATFNLIAMYDNCTLWLDNFVVGEEVIKGLPLRLQNARQSVSIDTGETYSFGYIDGLRVNIYLSGISIKGSLSKFFYSNEDNRGNLLNLNRHTTRQAIEKLSERLGVDADMAKVRSLEFGTYFVMINPVADYLNQMGVSPRLRRINVMEQTLYYKHRSKQSPKVLKIYDKRAEAVQKGYKLPSGFENANLLKYELTLNGSIGKRLKWGEVTASTLYNGEFYRRLMQMYIDCYFMIEKRPQLKSDIDMAKNIKSVGDACNALMARLLNQSGIDLIDSFVSELKSQSVFVDRANYTRLKKKLNEIAAKSGFTMSNDLISELDDCIINIGADEGVYYER